MSEKINEQFLAQRYGYDEVMKTYVRLRTIQLSECREQEEVITKTTNNNLNSLHTNNNNNTNENNNSEESRNIDDIEKEEKIIDVNKLNPMLRRLMSTLQRNQKPRPINTRITNNQFSKQVD